MHFCSNMLADVHLVVDRALISPLDGVRLASQRRSQATELVGRKMSYVGGMLPSTQKRKVTMKVVKHLAVDFCVV